MLHQQMGRREIVNKITIAHISKKIEKLKIMYILD
uniref:Uncharacterized protein n=1 Tax=Lepeophtheirus salmonis TaxID=72036 RepID=A0A0K2UDG4_LEPSM